MSSKNDYGRHNEQCHQRTILLNHDWIYNSFNTAVKSDHGNANYVPSCHQSLAFNGEGHQLVLNPSAIVVRSYRIKAASFRSTSPLVGCISIYASFHHSSSCHFPFYPGINYFCALATKCPG
jgi:hypothetical protein